MTTPKSIGRYEIIDELGQGAMGSVFRARDPKMDRIVAVKTILSSVLASDMGDEYRERFYREARAAGALAHPGIVPVFDVGEQAGVPYLVMEFVRGRTLDYAMKKGERFSLERVCEIGEQIAEALGYAHRNGVIHRDIKPANILLTSPETYGDERPKITDFGVAKLMDSGFTSVGKFLGTPAFMSPEQFTGTAIDGRADLYSLGVILYWLATGEQPFPGESLTAISYKVVQTEPVPPAKLNPAIPARLESVILKCLKKNPAERYLAGEELAQDLALLREGSKTPSLQATAPLTRGTGRESEATFDLNSGFPKSLPAAEITALDGKPLQQKNTGARLAAAVVLLAAMAVGGGYLFLHRRQPVAVAQPQIPATMASEQPVTTKPPALGKPLIKTPEATPAANNSATATNTAQTSSVAFDPKSLDPKQNTRLKVELDHFPAGLEFTIAMNGKTYFKGKAGNKADYEGLLVPPGVQEFRVTVRGGGVQKASNTVSAEFLAGKRMALKVEFRTPAGSSGASPVLDPGAQIIVSLKTDRFFL